MKKIVILISFFIILLSGISNADWEVKNLTTYFGYTSNLMTVAWDVTPGATSYDLRLKHVERNTYGQYGNVSTPMYTFQLPRTGHFIVEIRSVNEFGKGDWMTSESINTFTDPQYDPFWIYGYPEPVGPIIIN